MEEKNGKLKIENIESTLEVNTKCMNQLQVNDSIKTPGVHVHPKSHWDGKILVMKENIRDSIAKLNDIEIKPCLMRVYFNACLMQKVFFGCGIIELKEQSEIILRKCIKQ